MPEARFFLFPSDWPDCLLACLFETAFCYIAQAGQELAKELRLLPSSLDPFVPVSRFCND